MSDNLFTLNVGLRLLAAYLDLHKDELIKAGAAEAKKLLRAALEKKFNRAVPKIAVKMAAEGWTLAVKPAADCVRDAEYRLWRTVFPAILSDAFRDSHESHVLALVGTVDPATPLEDLVRRVAASELDVTF